MKEENVIEIRDVHKKFRNYYDKNYSLKDKMIHSGRRKKYEDNWVLRGISFDVKRGDVVGLIGRNGCGKSTTLKLMSKIIYPDKGEVETRGRVSSLLELGAGFHPDLSGYENIYLNAAVFGLTKKEIDLRVDDIVRFSELGSFMENPIRTYSSGMYMKLAFSVAINVEADILLIDEILGVGDVSFQKKCFEKLLEIKENGTTIVIVSHSTDQIERICDRSIWIEEGKIRDMGTPKDVHAVYLATMEERRLKRKEQERIEIEEREKERNERREKERLEIERKEKAGRDKINKNREERQKKQEQLKSNIDVKSTDELNDQVRAELDRQEELRTSLEERLKQREESKKEANNKTDRELFEEVLNDKNIEVDYLNSVIRQNSLEKERIESEKNAEILRLEELISDKEEEIDRLNEVIIGKDNELIRLEGVITDKDDEINRLNDLLIGKDV